MKLKKLTITGFRGFNLERQIDFHEKLTVIGAANSHGKTSISEALEFLLYGATSKVAEAHSKEEYKGSYRNRHFPADKAAYVEAAFSETDNVEHTLRIELEPDGNTTRCFHNGVPVEIWPFDDKLRTTARPFVLQHALKDLLLVRPVDRFQKFARLLGLDDVDDAFKAILSLCTKPESSVLPDAQDTLSKLAELESKCREVPELTKTAAAFSKGVDPFSLIEARADILLKGSATPEKRLSNLAELRDKEVARVYSGDIAVHPHSREQREQYASSLEALTTVLGSEFAQDYEELCVPQVNERLRKEANLLDVGTELIREDPVVCPLCEQLLDEQLLSKIEKRHAARKTELDRARKRGKVLSRVQQVLADMKKRIGKHVKVCECRVRDLITSMEPANAPKVFNLLGGGDSPSVEIVRSKACIAGDLVERLRAAGSAAVAAIEACSIVVEKDRANKAHLEELRKALNAYLADVQEFEDKLPSIEEALREPARLFRENVDKLAGTQEVSLLIELLEKRTLLERALRVRDFLEKLKKNLKKSAEQALGEIMDMALNKDLTDVVMKWYRRIRTDGDPDVHFAGFGMERTRTGTFKSRRLSIRAESYGVELASAVSSLSESKLNALGLCVSIANAVRSQGPCSFLIFDDPIQSWDAEHESKFIDIIRTLIEREGKQVVVLSHNSTWAKQVCQGCRTLNGLHYEITGYTKDGPHIREVEWCPIKERLREIRSLAVNPTATAVQLGQAEADLRLVACQVASLLAREKLDRDTSAHKLNATKVRRILVDACCESVLVDKISQVFVTADDAHHAPKTYIPNKQRILNGHAAITMLLSQIEPNSVSE